LVISGKNLHEYARKIQAIKKYDREKAQKPAKNARNIRQELV